MRDRGNAFVDKTKQHSTESERDKQQNERGLYAPLRQAFVRIPTLPIEALAAAENGVAQIKEDSLLHEAIFIASSSLIASLARPESVSPRKLKQLNSSLLKYIIRMSSRTTPFGLFAGVAQIPVGEHTSLPLSDPKTHHHRSRLDMEWLFGYITLLEADPNILPSLTYTYQPITVRVGNRYHFEHWDDQSNLTNTSVIATLGVEKLIQKTHGGKKYAELFAEMLAEIPEAEPEEMKAFLAKFIRYGVIRSSLRPPLTCADPAEYIAGQLEKIPAARAIALRFRDLLAQIRQYDAFPPGEGESKLHDAIANAEETYQLPTRRFPFDIDLALQFTKKPCIQQSIADDAARLAEIFLRLSADPTHSTLTAYKEKITERYGQHRRIPILELLDPNVGIGPPEHYRSTTHGHQPTRAQRTKRDKVLLKLALDAVRSKQTVIQLDDKTIKQLTTPGFDPSKMPESLDLAIQIAADSAKGVNARKYLAISSPLTGAQAAGQSAGRFADLLGEGTVDYLQEVVNRQLGQNGNILHAEVVYIPRTGHAANVAIRPALRKYEITLGVAAGVPADDVIPLNDILVGARHDRLYLWSNSRQKEIVAHSGHMLNRRSAPNVCRLLLDISGDRQAMLTDFSWGIAAYLPMLPRVSYGRLVLALAEWRLDSEELLGDIPQGKQAKRPPVDIDTWHSSVSNWRNKWHVPRFVYLTDSDNRLLLDLESAEQAMELFYAATRHGKLGSLRIQEGLPGPGDAWIQNKHGHHLNEFVIPLTRTLPLKVAESPTDPMATVTTDVRTTPADRTFLPGSRWLYCKFYIPTQHQNEHLALYIEQLVRAVASHKAAGSWFYIRYADPEPHIRIRFDTHETTITKVLLPIVFAWSHQMQAAGILQKIVIDTYDRELERYGGSAAIELAEAIFATESVADLGLICLSEEKALGNLQLTDIIVLTTSILLHTFGCDDTQQIAWSKRQSTEYKRFADQYRKDRSRILTLFQEYRDGSLKQYRLQAICNRLADQLKPLGIAYRRLETTAQLSLPLNIIMGSFVHMHSNRLIGIDRPVEQRTLVYISRALSDLPKWQQKK